MSDTLTENLNCIEDTQKDKFLTFSVEKETYGIEIKYVTEIIGMQEITVVPELAEYIIGIINLRGSIIPVIDVRLRFKKQTKEYNDRTCIIVIEIQDVAVGLIVDSVSEVLTIDDKNIVPPPDIKTGFHNRYVKGIGKVGNCIKLLLDCDKLLNDDEVDKITNII